MPMVNARISSPNDSAEARLTTHNLVFTILAVKYTLIGDHPIPAKYPNIWLIWLFGYLAACDEHGQVKNYGPKSFV